MLTSVGRYRLADVTRVSCSEPGVPFVRAGTSPVSIEPVASRAFCAICYQLCHAEAIVDGNGWKVSASDVGYAETVWIRVVNRLIPAAATAVREAMIIER